MNNLEREVPKKKCILCGDFFSVKHPSDFKTRKFCSKKCADTHRLMNVKLRGGGYSAIHKWLLQKYGRADRCEGKDCRKKKNKFHYALRKGFVHAHRRENYIMLCASCHKRYDLKEGFVERLANLNTGKNLSEEHKRKISEACKGINRNNQHSARKIVDSNGIVYPSITKASKINNTSVSNISTCLAGITKTAGGLGWRYVS